MRYHNLFTWAVMLVLGLALTMAASAQRDNGNNNNGLRIGQRNQDDADDQRVYQQWFREQVRGYDEIDPESGEPINVLLHLVTDVRGARIEIMDRDYDRHTVLVTDRTRVSYQSVRRSYTPQGQRARPLPPDPARASKVRPGDLVIVQGYLRANGQFTASTLRIVDHAYGWGDDWNDMPGFSGYRAWGEILEVNVSRGTMVINTDSGRKTVSLARNGIVLAKGKEEAFTYLRRGDRVVFYYRNNSGSTLQVYRIVWLDRNDRYPQSNRPHWADPDDDDQAGLLAITGRIISLRTGSVFFNRMVIRTDNGQEINLRIGKAVKATDRYGDGIELDRLRSGDRVRVRYNDLNGIYVAYSVSMR